MQKIEDGHFTLDTSPFRARDIVSNVALGGKSAALAKNIDLVVETVRWCRFCGVALLVDVI